jgi:U4/U6 small nuclear ribonucleoprotein PRP3
VRIANIARILGTQSVQEPSKVEAEIRAQAQKRQQEHLDANLERHEKAKEETARKTLDRQNESMVNVPVAVFRIDNLTLSQWRFKVVKNAEQNELTGCVIYYEQFSLVVVEGKTAAVRRYKHLLLDRIKWTETPPGSDPTMNVSQNRCILVWEGVVGKRSFYRFDNWTFSNEIDARAYLGKFGVEHYWKIAKDS